ncbi:hypothetical protein [Nocardia tengchongensis]
MLKSLLIAFGAAIIIVVIFCAVGWLVYELIAHLPLEPMQH